MAGENVPLLQPGASTPEEMELLRRNEELRKVRKKKPAEAKMSMTPLIDIVFLLIFFFMVVTDLSNMEIESVALPFALKAKEDPTTGQGRLIVNITDRGEIRMMRRPVTTERLFTELQKRAKTNGPDRQGLPKVSVKIRADSKAEYKYVQEVMVQCMRAYVWKISFGARRAPDEDALLRTF